MSLPLPHQASTSAKMDSRTTKLGLALVVLVAAFCYEAKAQSGCTSVLMGLSPCLNYITGNSSTPSSPCCSQLSRVVQSQPQCLCEALKGGASSLGITINQTRALELPDACNVQTPPVSRCNDANGSAPSPGSSTPPADTSDATPTSGTGSKATPTTTGNTSGGSIMTISIAFTIFALSIASSISSAAM